MFMHWTYKGKEVKELPDWVAGFVYEITNTKNGRKYVGKKLAKFRRSRRPLKGRINKRRYTVPSDWQDYFGSSNALLEDVEKIWGRKVQTLTPESLQMYVLLVLLMLYFFVITP